MFSRINNVLKRSVALRGPMFSIDFDPESLYMYSSGRWLWREELQMTCRMRKASMTELAQAAAPIAESRSCVKSAELFEDSFNEAFLLTMDDGQEIVAKLPNPNAGYRHLTTASEVATIDCARNILGVPVPQVYAWSSTADNPISAEYILTEECPGIELHNVCDTINARQKAAITNKLVKYKAAFASLNLPVYGSLYYAKDVRSTDRCILPLPEKSTRCLAVAICPNTDRNFFDHGRADATAIKGPCSTVEEYNLAIVEREIAKGLQIFPTRRDFTTAQDNTSRAPK